MIRTPLVLLFALAGASTASAATPEIKRPPAAPQANGVAHTVRGLPEACATLQGRFTGQAVQPYAFSAARTGANCQARARLVDPAKANPSLASGWKLNDVVRIPSSACPGLQAVVQIWRKPVAAKPPTLDAQGRARLYLMDAKAAAGASPGAVTQYAAKVAVEGKPCG